MAVALGYANAAQIVKAVMKAEILFTRPPLRPCGVELPADKARP